MLARKVQISLGPHPGLSWSSEPAVEGSGCDFHHWRVGFVVWKGCSWCNLGLCGVVPTNLLQVLPVSSASSPMRNLCVSGTRIPEHYFTPFSYSQLVEALEPLFLNARLFKKRKLQDKNLLALCKHSE